jgi:hypothetical protein
MGGTPWRWTRVLVCVLGAGLATGCSTNQLYSTEDHNNFKLKPNDLQDHGVAFITPSTVTGQEQDKQTLALLVGKALTEARPGVRVIPLPETLSAVNRAGYAGKYRAMYDDYQSTGIFPRDILQRVGEVAGVRYLVQLKLASFSQNSQERFAVFGMRLFETKRASIRLFAQIWDSYEGAIVWEGVEELNYAYDTGREVPVTFRIVVEEATRRLVQQLP